MTADKPSWTRRELASPHTDPAKALRVRGMFNRIARRYALINSLFSLGRDAVWRREAVRLGEAGPADDLLDIACGTGDFARAFATAGTGPVVACDFAHDMLVHAADAHRRHSATLEERTPLYCEADALRLPFAAGRFSLVSCAFGVRNFQNLDAGFSEMFRVLQPQGRAVILEFTRPTRRLARWFYELYATRLMPVAATLISGDRSGAYRYLPRSVVSFLDAEQMCERLRQAGFERVTATPLTMGIVTVYVARR